MGTRCLTVVLDESGTEILNMYRQMDGYPDGHGKDLAKFIGDRPLMNGISTESVKLNAFNGAGCLAAAIVAHFKTDVGGFYLLPPGSRDHGEEYVYTIRTADGKIDLTHSPDDDDDDNN